MTSSRKVMGEYANRTFTNVLLWGIGIIVTVMNIYLLIVGYRDRFGGPFSIYVSKFMYLRLCICIYVFTVMHLYLCIYYVKSVSLNTQEGYKVWYN